jgi:hypothetical protein
LDWRFLGRINRDDLKKEQLGKMGRRRDLALGVESVLVFEF